ncbi:hypothetical protein V8F06_009166 [Rhypophila decipiens]
MAYNVQLDLDASIVRDRWLICPIERKTPTGTKKTLREFSLDERQWYERMQAEEIFYMETMEANFRHMLRVRLSDDPEEINKWRLSDSPQEISRNKTQFKATCGKSVGIYFDDSGGMTFRTALFNYTYRRWYRPYANNLDSGPFLAKLLKIVGTRDDFDWLPQKDCCQDHDDDVVDSLVPLRKHRRVTQEELRKEYIRRIAEIAAGAPKPDWVKDYVEDHERYVVQPLFRALIIGAFPDYYLSQTSRTVGNMSVFLIRTGVEEGLSAPITFDSLEGEIDPLSPSYSSKDGDVVRVSLDAAIDFVQALEAREMAVSGSGPHRESGKMPLAISTNVLMFNETTQEFYNVPYEGPEVDLAKHPDWIHTPDTSLAERNMNSTEKRSRRWQEEVIKRDRETSQAPALCTETSVERETSQAPALCTETSVERATWPVLRPRL